jgi:HTH-type transcriptional regulator/antitoxin HipB
MPAQLGSQLRAARLQAGLTQADVAGRLGITTQAVSRLEKEAGKASFDRIHRLCALLGLDIALLARADAGSAAGHGGEW